MALKDAVAERAPVIVSVHGAVPEQPLAQPAKLEPAADLHVAAAGAD